MMETSKEIVKNTAMETVLNTAMETVLDTKANVKSWATASNITRNDVC